MFYQKRGFIGLDEIWVWSCRFGFRSFQVPMLGRMVCHAERVVEAEKVETAR